MLTQADNVAVELAAMLLAEARELSVEFHPAKLAQLRGLLGSFGMTPADRSKVKAINPVRKSRLASLDEP